jgi:hypothetical protein
MEVGDPVEAYGSVKLCLHYATVDPKTALRDQAEDRCRKLLPQLAAKVGQIVIDLPAPPPGTTLQVAGKLVHVELAGTPYAVHPGTVTLEATAPGYLLFTVKVDVAAAETKTVAVSLQREPCAGGTQRAADGQCLPVAVASPAPAGSQVGPQVSPQGLGPMAADLSARSTPPGSSGTGSAQRRLGLVLGGGGAVLLAAGGVAWLVANSKYGSIKDACDAGCTTQGRADGISSVQTWDRVAGVGLIGGGVLLAAGVTLFLVSSPTDSAGPAPVALDFDPLRGVLSAKGSF